MANHSFRFLWVGRSLVTGANASDCAVRVDGLTKLGVQVHLQSFRMNAKKWNLYKKKHCSTILLIQMTQALEFFSAFSQAINSQQPQTSIHTILHANWPPIKPLLAENRQTYGFWLHKNKQWWLMENSQCNSNWRTKKFVYTHTSVLSWVVSSNKQICAFGTSDPIE